MSRLTRLVNRWRRGALDREFDDELRFHFDSRVEANLRGGMDCDAAAAEARRHLGSTLRAREGMREARINPVGEWLLRDLRHGWRVLRRQPVTALLAVVTLSLGIGANAAIFSLLNAILFRPLPFDQADRLVAIVDEFRATAPVPARPTIPEILDARAGARTLDGISFFDLRDFQMNGGSEPMRVLGARVEPPLFGLLRVRPARGRLLTDADARPGAPAVVVLSDGLWQANFGGDPAVVGRQVIVNARPATVVGVMAPDSGFNTLVNQPIDMFVPYPMTPTYTSRQAEFANVRRVDAIARLAAGATLETTRAELETISRNLVAAHGALYRRESDGRSLGFVMSAVPLRERVSPATAGRRTLGLLTAAVVLVLLIACVNTVQFLLAQSAERESEVALRSALGAGRLRLVRQFLAEALLLAVAAGTVGVVQALWLTRLLSAVLPDGVLRVGPVAVDGAVLAFTAIVALATTMACGLFPALRFSQLRPARSLDTRGAAPGRGRSRQVFIGVEVAVSVVLLVSAGLLLRSVGELSRAPRGFSGDGVTVMRMRGLAAGSLGPMYQQYLQQVARLPGVEAVAIASGPLPEFAEEAFSVIGDAARRADVSRQLAAYHIISPGYFTALKIPMLQGRLFTDGDAAGRPPVAIVNQELVRRVFGSADPIGRQIRSGPGPRAATMTIVGVVGDVKPLFAAEPEPQIYVSYLQQAEPSVVMLVRARPGREVAVTDVKRAIWAVAPQQAVFGVEPLAAFVSAMMADHRVVAVLLGSFAFLALFMSATGIYTVVSYLISRRTREIALRRAVGARGFDVLALLAGPTFRWTLLGIGAGAAGAVAVGGALRAAIVGLVPFDAWTLGVVPLVYLAVVAVAMGVPALRALRLDPATALRAE